MDRQRLVQVPQQHWAVVGQAKQIGQGLEIMIREADNVWMDRN